MKNKKPHKGLYAFTKKKDTEKPIINNTTPPIKSGIQQYIGIFFFRNKMKLSKMFINPEIKATSINATAKYSAFIMTAEPPYKGLQQKLGKNLKIRFY